MITLPLIFSLENSTKAQSKKLKSLVRSKKKTKANLKEINDMISESGGFKYAKDKLNEFSEKAIDAIQRYEESEIKKSLTKLVTFNINRIR